MKKIIFVVIFLFFISCIEMKKCNVEIIDTLGTIYSFTNASLSVRNDIVKNKITFIVLHRGNKLEFNSGYIRSVKLLTKNKLDGETIWKSKKK